MIDDPFSDLLKTNKRKENISKLNDDLAYEILSVVEEIPAGRVATYGQGEEFQIGGGSVVTCRELWEVSLPSGGEPYGEAGTGVDRAGVAAERGRSYSERKWLCRFEEIFVGMLILERVYNDKEKSKTNTEYIFMVFTYCSTGKCFCTAVLQEAR